MPSKPPTTTDTCTTQLQALGAQIRSQRKALRMNATVTAEAAGLSRVTLHRIEKGEPSVTMGAWCSAMAALGMALQARSGTDTAAQATDRTGWIPARVALADYPQLRALAWQVHGTDTLTPMEALDIYERNARHLDLQAMSADEQALLQALRLALSRKPGAEDAV
ncbi:transcriptional regulator with XRE-family HTH domain [Rhodoferax ferrireducens]|uniref:Transcriptional regulator with XRE-family HTH domain n=1 Tax=Rhodoferax ferrireducens TaxID=192843 RepID=A0ABU2C795_9BURK|nr:helix-turn-helix domain-containing protein [Rhodoferax ferrireducens]MDR7377196.1 transcriptional regulator with XRE-family HTH domain [Rhodoferax ferrireducens]